MTLFYRSPSHTATRSYLVELAQIALEAQNCPTGGTDGVFGKGTEDAVRRWQIANGFDETGVITLPEWEVLTGLPQPSEFDLCLHMTAAIEGHGFSKPAGNFDGAGVTWGIIGFALTGGLPDLLAAIQSDREAKAEALSIFTPSRWERLIKASKGTRAQKQAFGDSISVGSCKAHLQEDWARAFKRLGRVGVVQRLQIEASRRYWLKAVDTAKRYDAKELLDVAMFFDACVQHGSISGKRKEMMDRVGPKRSWYARRVAWANAMADATGTRWREKVRARRMFFATGEGRIHGAEYLAATWGLTNRDVKMSRLADCGAITKPRDYQSAPTYVFGPAVRSSVDWLEEVPVPAGFNEGLRSVSNTVMIQYFGLPRGDFDQTCKESTNTVFREQCQFGAHVPQLGKIWWGLRPALDSLHDVMADISRRVPQVYDIMGQAGVGCCRHVRGSSSSISNHSWGSAIDITLGGRVDPYNNDKITRGMIEIIPIFNEHKWYSGAYFGREDCMHLEVSKDLLEMWAAGGKLDPILNPSDPTPSMLQQGARGEAVKDLQRKLNQLGYGLVVDGIFGSGTTAAVKAFQMRAGLTADGIAGAKTQLALDKVIKSTTGHYISQ
ncbi:MAG: peptidoglycan-binding protein [Octadecabacter sp.]|nr:peptidoglycan-binding protein [Octadecabacter sp.]